MQPIVRRVWDNLSGTIQVPEEMYSTDTPRRADQLQGSPLDQLSELAGRVCYDSLFAPQSRNSEQYHKHIQDVRHHSVYRHAHLILEMDPRCLFKDAVLLALSSQPGVTITAFDMVQERIHMTWNLQAILEWHHRKPLPVLGEPPSSAYNGFQKRHQRLGQLVVAAAKPHAPLTLHAFPAETNEGNMIVVRAQPQRPSEVYISLFFSNVSRGWSHEMVRHSWQCAPSQRSTRYVDESWSPWVPHPTMDDQEREWMRLCESLCRDYYKRTVLSIWQRLKDQGYDTLTARKQARGAARGILGNALSTEMIFTASLPAWQIIFQQRCSPHADKEMQRVAEEARKCVADCIQGYNFPDFRL